LHAEHIAPLVGVKADEERERKKREKYPSHNADIDYSELLSTA